MIRDYTAFHVVDAQVAEPARVSLLVGGLLSLGAPFRTLSRRARARLL